MDTDTKAHDGDTCEETDDALDRLTGDLNDATMALGRAGIPHKTRVEGEVVDMSPADQVRDLVAQRDRLHAFAWWLIEMDHPDNAAGMERRRTTNLTQIIDRARDALDAATEHNHPSR